MTSDQLTRAFNDQQLEVEFTDGFRARVLVVLVCDSDCHSECKGIVYEVVSPDRPDWKKSSDVYWTEMKYIKDFEVVRSSE